MSKKLSNIEKELAYMLSKRMGYKQENIAKLMDTSQGTISNGIRDISHERELNELMRFIGANQTPDAPALPSKD